MNPNEKGRKEANRYGNKTYDVDKEGNRVDIPEPLDWEEEDERLERKNAKLKKKHSENCFEKFIRDNGKFIYQ